jgi:hypothetical protein
MAAKSKKPKPLPSYPPEFGNAYQVLGIILGKEDFDEKMEALKSYCQGHQKPEYWNTPEEEKAMKYLCEYYHIKRVELDKQ